MSENSRDLVIMIAHGIDNELSSGGFTIANGGITAGLKVSIFLTSSGVDLVRKGAADATQVHPLGTLWACTPCVKARAYDEDDLIEGIVVTGAAPMHALIKDGAATLTF